MKRSFRASQVNLWKIVLSLAIYSDFIIRVGFLLRAVPPFDTVCPAASNVASYGFIYTWWGVKWGFCWGQMMSPCSQENDNSSKKESLMCFCCLCEFVSHFMACVCTIIRSRVSHGSCVRLSAVAFGRHCVITAGCERAGCTARKQSSLINPCW